MERSCEVRIRTPYRFIGAFVALTAAGAFLEHRSWAQDNVGAGIRSSLTFHASFDESVNADFAKGDRLLRTAPSSDKRANAIEGLPKEGNVQLVPEQGKYGGAIRFQKSIQPIVFYRGVKNLPALRPNWECTVSFWLRTDPFKELREGFCDPIQITSKQWDDAAAFVEFEKRGDRVPFRLGVYADKKVWNPTGRAFETIPAAERPLATVDPSPFFSGDWTHVLFVMKGFNTGRPNGESKLYLNGKLAAELSPREQTFTWQEDQSAIMIGLSYMGLMDDLAIFDRALTDEEISHLNALPKGIRDLR